MLRMWRRAAKQLDTVRDTWVFIDMSLSITDIYTKVTDTLCWRDIVGTDAQ